MRNLYFSERELGKRVKNLEEINYTIYNGIIGIINSQIINFCIDYPEYCYDNSNLITGTSTVLLEDSILAYIGLDNPLIRVVEFAKIDTYKVLDLIEFCYDHIKGITNIEYHAYFKHSHYCLNSNETVNEQERFRANINRLFEVNGLIFSLNENGQVVRDLPVEMENVIKGINLNTKDNRLNELISLAINGIKKPRQEDRNIALEKLWDAYERMKTYYQDNKRVSTEELIKIVAKNESGIIELLNIEFRTLTDIGNSFQIRHFECDKVEIKESKHIDYLFYRMIALINLCVLELE
ncbi:MAG: AbiJ-NTD4 domain-containing protein [Sarcina sp.]